MIYEEMFPCRAQIIRTREGRDSAPLDEYSYPEDTGEFTGTLTFRCWHRNKPMLLCYFDTNDGRKLKLSVWWQSWGVEYSPAETHISFADEVFDGNRWRCAYRKKGNDYIYWLLDECNIRMDSHLWLVNKLIARLPYTPIHQTSPGKNRTAFFLYID